MSNNMELKLPNVNDIKERKSFLFKMDTMSDDEEYAYVEGYGAVKGNMDFGDDVIVDNAFSKTYQERKGVVPFLRDHTPTIDNTLGKVFFKEDEYGLRCKFQVNLDTQAGKEFYSLAKQFGDMMGFSIGFSIPKGKSEYKEIEGKTVRLIKEVILYEVSATLYPMNDKARAISAKSLLDICENYSYIPTSLLKQVVGSSEEPADTSIGQAEANKSETKELELVVSELKQLLQRL